MTEPHRFALRIFWEDMDAGGIICYANYLRFLERGRSEMARGAGIDQAAMYNLEGVMLPVRRCEIDYLKPAQLDDEVGAHTRLRKIGGASMDLDQDIYRGADILLRAKMRLACFGWNGKPERVPETVRDALTGLIEPMEELGN